MLSRHRENDLLDPFLLGGQVHHHMKETLFEVAHKLHSAVHVVMYGHERRLSSSTEPADWLVADVQKPSECLEIISLAFDETVEHLALIVRTAHRDKVQHSVKPTSWKHCSKSGNNVGPSRCLFAGNLETTFDSKSGSV